jgi:phosphatidylserine decarboxylase
MRVLQLILASLISGLSYAKLPRFLLRFVVMKYVQFYKINLEEYDVDINNITTFDEFFSRHLRQNVRKIENGIVSPVDGIVYSVGEIENDTILQVKQNRVSVSQLVDERIDAKYYLNLYLSPAHYHRFHAPADLEITKITYIPGYFFSVRPKIAEKRDVFIKNERVVMECSTERRKIWIVVIGAQNVGKIELHALNGLCPTGKTIQEIAFSGKNMYQKSEELGAFHLGSSIVILSENIRFTAQAGKEIRLGTQIASA